MFRFTENRLRDEVAGGLGFEPRLTESESAVLPLNYPPIASYFNNLAIWTKPQSRCGADAALPCPGATTPSTSRASARAFQASRRTVPRVPIPPGTLGP